MIKHITLFSIITITFLFISCKDETNPVSTNYFHDVSTDLIGAWDQQMGQGASIDSALVFTSSNMIWITGPIITDNNTFITAKDGQIYFEVNGNTNKVYQYDYTISNDTLYIANDQTATATNPNGSTNDVNIFTPHQ